MSRGGWRYGAGRPGWHAKTAGKLAVDIRRLQRDGHLAGHQRMTWRWSSGAAVEMETSPDDVTLIYRYKDRQGDWRDVAQRIAIMRTPCHYGGNRPWFACPRCSARVAIIYLWNVPLCRKCARLVYPSQSKDAIDRSWGRTERVMRRLGQVGEGPHAIPRRPKGMRQATFERLWLAWLREEECRADLLTAFVTRMEARMDWRR